MTKEDVKSEYDKLIVFSGAKKRASDIHGVSGEHFRTLLESDKTSQDRLMQMSQAIKQSAFEAMEKIKEINVELGNEVS